MALDDFIVRPRTQTAHEYVRDALRAAVLDGTLVGGSRLVQADLATRLGVSTTPVREALRNLASEGLVIFDPHRGALVRSLDINEVRELYELRMLLEPVMVRRVVSNVSLSQLAHAEDLQHAMAATDDTNKWAELNRDFHALFNTVDAGSRLASVLDGLRDSAEPYVALSLIARPQQIPEANDEHALLIDLYRARDADQIVNLTIRHFQSTLNAIEQAHEDGKL